ncbi:MAG: prolipoprotein diacylglyceryl transferase [Clostridiales bacterium]|nr:prolipoprotein diacylglyceryl transferase [Clostridiales bacterium]
MKETTFVSVFTGKMYLFGSLIALGAAIYFLLTAIFAKKRGFKGYQSLYFAAWALPLAWFFARFFYVLVNLNKYIDLYTPWWRFLAFWDGGYSMMGALFGLIIGCWCFTKSNKISFGKWADVAVVPLGAFLCIARMAEGSVLYIGRGKSIDPQGLLGQIPFFTISDFQGFSPYYAIFRCEAIMGLVVMGISLWLFYSKKFAGKSKAGDLALLSTSLFGAAQVIFESLKDDGHLMIRVFVRFSQIFAIVFPVVAVVFFSVKVIQKSGWSWKPILSWLLVAIAIGVGIYQEFQIDVTANIVKEYLIMTGAVTMLLLTVIWMWRLLRGNNTERKKS